MTNRWRYTLGFLALVAASLWFAVFSRPKDNLSVIACDVGQGDAILIQFQDTQILIDGGRGRKVLDCLSSYMPPWDRKIELVVLTHPQLDHFGGLVEVVRRFDIDAFLVSGLDSEGEQYQVLKRELEQKSIKLLDPTKDTKISIGTIYLDVLWPSKEFVENYYLATESISSEKVLGTFTSKKDPNDFSIVVNLSYGEFDALLTGDIGPDIMDGILATGLIGDVEYLKVPHHGSKNGLTKELLEASTPEIAVISVGKNPWGHPHQEVINLLRDKGIKILRTDEVGDVEIKTDGKSWWLKD